MTVPHQSPYRWPAEWEPQAATWIAWPHNLDTWPNRFENVPACFSKLVRTLAEVQPVHVLVNENCRDSATAHLNGNPNIHLHDVPTNDCWIRDYGPTFVQRVDDRTLVGVDWKYNAWGGKYPPFDLDAAAAETICKTIGCPRNQSSIYCEGGALEGNGARTLLTTERCLLNPRRNPGWSKEMIERELGRQLGVDKIIWLAGDGLEGDDTDGHIDQLARFVNRSTVVVAACSDADDPNAASLAANRRLLQSSTTADGEPIEVYELPIPRPRMIDGVRVPESYCNFLIANGIVIVPTFRHESTDRPAIELLTHLFSDRTVVPLDAFDLIWGLGAFHCASQQQPEAATAVTIGRG
ncbi:MAG: agmatine deiminase family protein [Planctomycetota bacterium]|nr:MAG: agmatine deiminase family protein [Planctomycetota bacterium]